MRRLFAVLATMLAAAPLSAQSSTQSIAPGMSRANVVAALGEPATVRSAAEFTYLFYRNSCGKECGMNDLVVLRGDSVVDAIFRSPSRHYTGKSSSPAPISAKDAARAQPGTASTAHDAKPAAPAKPATTAKPSTRMKPPAEANDARPSIPVKSPTMSPAPSSSPATRSP